MFVPWTRIIVHGLLGSVCSIILVRFQRMLQRWKKMSFSGLSKISTVIADLWSIPSMAKFWQFGLGGPIGVRLELSFHTRSCKTRQERCPKRPDLSFKTRSCKTRQDKRSNWCWARAVIQDKILQDKTRQDETGQDEISKKKTIKTIKTNNQKNSISFFRVCENRSKKAWAQLPVRFGGLGVRSAKDIALPAFLSSSYATKPLQDAILEKIPNRTGESPHRTAALNSWAEGHCTRPEEPKLGIQKEWDNIICKEQYDTILQGSQTDEYKACLAATASQGSGAWLHALPVESLGLKLTDDQVRIAAGLRVADPDYGLLVAAFRYKIFLGCNGYSSIWSCSCYHHISACATNPDTDSVDPNVWTSQRYEPIPMSKFDTGISYANH